MNNSFAQVLRIVFAALMCGLLLSTLGCNSELEEGATKRDDVEWHQIGNLRFRPSVSELTMKNLVESGLLDAGLSLAASLDNGDEIAIRLIQMDDGDCRVMSRSRFDIEAITETQFLFPTVTINEEVRSEPLDSFSEFAFQQELWTAVGGSANVPGEVCHIPIWPRLGSDTMPDYLTRFQELQKRIGGGATIPVNKSLYRTVRATPLFRVQSHDQIGSEVTEMLWEVIPPSPQWREYGVRDDLRIINFDFGVRWKSLLMEAIKSLKPGSYADWLVNGWSVARIHIAVVSTDDPRKGGLGIRIGAKEASKERVGFLAYSILSSCELLSLSKN